MGVGTKHNTNEKINKQKPTHTHTDTKIYLYTSEKDVTLKNHAVRLPRDGNGIYMAPFPF